MSRYKCPQCGNIWTEGEWTEYTSERFCSDGCRRAYDDARTPRTKCDWCGCLYESGTGCKDSAGNHYCSNKCFRDAGDDPGVAAERHAAEDYERRQREEEERRRREEAARKARAEAEERARKADPNRWYPSEWVDYLKAHPCEGGRCPWTRLSFKATEWVDLLESQPRFWDKCREWTSFDHDDWAKVLKSCMKQSGFLAAIDRVLTGAGWAVLVGSDPSHDGRCKWEMLDVADWAFLLSRRGDLAKKCPCWNRFRSSEWCVLMANPRFWLHAWHCDWFELADSDWDGLVSRNFLFKPFRVFMFFATSTAKFLHGVGGLIVLAFLALLLLLIVL